MVAKEKYQIIQLQYLEMDIIAMYKSPSTNVVAMKEFIKDLTDLIEFEKNTIICGDLNLDPLQNCITDALESMGFHQIVSEPTHIEGRILDHFYAKPISFISQHPFIHPLYFSDHDAVCVSLSLTSMDACPKIKKSNKKRKTKNKERKIKRMKTCNE